MSDSSLLVGVYANVEAYGDLVDKVIERLRIIGSDPSSPDQNRLARLLIDASDQGRSSQSLEALMLDSMLRSDTGEPVVNLKLIGQRLLTDDVDRALRTQLEMLARGLEEERAEVARRLRGR